MASTRSFCIRACLARPLRVGCVLLLGATSLYAEKGSTVDAPSQLQVVEVPEKNGQILSYRYLGSSTEVVMRGTKLAPQARVNLKVGSRPGFVEIDINRGQISGLKPASQFGTDFLTYVLWAVSVDGKAANLGEITFEQDKPISINVTTPYQTFWLMLTAEPNYAVVDPSPLVVLYSASENKAGDGQAISGKLLYYTHYGDYDRKPVSAGSLPNVLLQARKAVELASKSGILATGGSKGVETEESRTREALKQAQEFLGRAEKAYKHNPKGADVAQLSRTSAQIAENARALALGAVGGALVRQLEREVERLKSQLDARTAEASALALLVPSPKPVPAPIPTDIGHLGINEKPERANRIAGVMSHPIAWFGLAGWGLALLLLFRRRSI